MKNTILILSLIFFAFSAQAQINYTNNTLASGASAIGENNTSTGTNSFVSGYNSQATGVYSTAIGHSSNASGMHSVALGSYSSAESPSGTAIGPHAVVGPNATGGVAVGNLVESHMPFSFVFGGASDYHDPLINNISNSLMIGFQSDIPTFFVGAASGPGTVGKVGVGTTNPVALLDVNGDINLSGNILKNGNPMQFSPWNIQSADLYYTGGKVGIGTSQPEANLHIAEGDVFIEDINAGIIMKSPDGQCWKGKVDNYGQFNFTAVDCGNLSSKNTLQGNRSFSVSPNPSKGIISLQTDHPEFVNTVTIINSAGSLIKHITEPRADTITIDLSSMPSGVYIITLLYKDNTVSSETLILK